jgi:hypothetical protein
MPGTLKTARKADQTSAAIATTPCFCGASSRSLARMLASRCLSRGFTCLNQSSSANSASAPRDAPRIRRVEVIGCPAGQCLDVGSRCVGQE